jgi:subtilisin family serine protease
MVAKPDIVAPGNSIDSLEAPNSTIFTNYPQVDILLDLYENVPGVTASVSSVTSTLSALISPNYIQLSGTSMATPFVSATVALMLQQRRVSTL